MFYSKIFLVKLALLLSLYSWSVESKSRDRSFEQNSNSYEQEQGDAPTVPSYEQRQNGKLRNPNYDQSQGGDNPKNTNFNQESGKQTNSYREQDGGIKDKDDFRNDVTILGPKKQTTTTTSGKNQATPSWRDEETEYNERTTTYTPRGGNGDYYKDRTTTFVPSKGAEYERASPTPFPSGYGGGHSSKEKAVTTTTTKKPWYVRFKNWSGEKFDQFSKKVQGRRDANEYY